PMVERGALTPSSFAPCALRWRPWSCLQFCRWYQCSPREVARRPGRDDSGGVGRIGRAREEVVRVVERNEALRMLRRRENPGWVVDADDVVRAASASRGAPCAATRCCAAGRA